MLKIIKTNRQAGITLVELLISMALSMIVVGAVLTVYVMTATSSSTSLQMTKLNQELTLALTVMVGDIRRAGYWGTTNPAQLDAPMQNPFNQIGAATTGTALAVFSGIADTTANGPQAAVADCITFAYDVDNDGLLQNADGTFDNNEITGFRLNNGAIQMRQSGDGAATTNDQCDTGSWVNMTDPSLINITALNFDLSESACINTAFGNTEADANCYDNTTATGYKASTAGSILVETRQVRVTIAAQLARDGDVRLTLEHTAKVRNELVWQAP